jgi:hypothetical protein
MIVPNFATAAVVVSGFSASALATLAAGGLCATAVVVTAAGKRNCRSAESDRQAS